MLTPLSQNHWADILPQLTLLSRRPTGIELYSITSHDAPPLVLVLKPNDRIELATLEQPMLLPPSTSSLPLLPEYLRVLEREGHRRGCHTRLLRITRPGDAPPQGIHARLPGWTRHSQLRQYRIPLATLAHTLAHSRPTNIESLRIEALPLYAPAEGSHFQKAPVYQPELVTLFEHIFQGCPDPELGDSSPYTLAMLELSLSASWLSPMLWRIYRDDQALGMIMARTGENGVGELCYAGIVPEARGDKSIGWKLLETVQLHLAAKGMLSVLCSVAMENLRSHAFFERVWGFESVGYEEVWRSVGAGKEAL